ncbi:hypothetical protein PYK79_16125 [Streptomyces sp. ID05-04B]|uniref:hypothetical protein n=1 Tax=Streptomyces sp. ID05-04B TaxID=3028661 RepID=UPI0029C49DE6|nr:hypothetical protein [Streptomyces sp. ID05-04B]MDX5564571.1 hypothetical protein [Streptomyces sp. ID05-04B]
MGWSCVPSISSPSLPQPRPILHPALPCEDEAGALRSVARLGKAAADGGQERDLHDLLKPQELTSTELLHAFLHSYGCDADDWTVWHQTRTRLKIAQLLNRPRQPLGLLRRDRFIRTAATTLLTLILLVAIATLTLTK